MMTMDGSFVTVDTISSMRQKFSSVLFTNGSNVAQAAVNYMNDLWDLPEIRE